MEIKVDTLAEEEEYLKQCEEAYQKYAALCSLYEKLIEQDEDPKRKQMLEAMLGDLHEENK